MAVNTRIISEDYKSISVLIDIDATTDLAATFIDADTLLFYDTLTPNSVDVKLGLSSAFWSLSGDEENSGGRLSILLKHKTTDTVLLTLSNAGKIGFSKPLTFPDANQNGVSNDNHNGDVAYDIEENTTGHAVLTFTKVSGYKMAWKGWSKPTQKI